MLSLLVLLAAVGQSGAAPTTGPVESGGRTGIWALLVDGQCIFHLTDAGETAKDLQRSLRFYEPSRLFDILVDDDTPPRCEAQGRRALRKAGFTDVGVRRGTVLDDKTIP